MDKKLHVYPSGKREWLYKDICRQCGSFRGYVKKHMVGHICRRCAGVNVGKTNLGKPGPNRGRMFSEQARQKMSRSKQGITPANKGTRASHETRLKQSAAKLGKIPWNKGKGNSQAPEDLKRRARHYLRRFLSGAPSMQWMSSVVGKSSYELRCYLESKFYPNPATGEPMTWDNYGDWHIDHVVPLSSFDLTSLCDFKRACHYTNLQPLWAEDNLRKSSKLSNM